MLQLINEAKLTACIVGGAGLFILIHALLSPMDPNGGAVHVGACTSSTVLSATLGAAMASGGFTYVLFGGRSGPSSLVPASPSGLGPTAGRDVAIASAAEGPESGVPEKSKEYGLILRLLDGDDRMMFRAIVGSGGEALQKDLILRTGMSHAKVSRVLDRLEGKGLINKERYGSTNRIEISEDRGRPASSSPPSD